MERTRVRHPLEQGRETDANGGRFRISRLLAGPRNNVLRGQLATGELWQDDRRDGGPLVSLSYPQASLQGDLSSWFGAFVKFQFATAGFPIFSVRALEIEGELRDALVSRFAMIRQERQ